LTLYCLRDERPSLLRPWTTVSGTVHRWTGRRHAVENSDTTHFRLGSSQIAVPRALHHALEEGEVKPLVWPISCQCPAPWQGWAAPP